MFVAAGVDRDITGAAGLVVVSGIGVGFGDTRPQRAEQGEEALGCRVVSFLFRASSVAVCGERVSRRE